MIMLTKLQITNSYKTNPPTQIADPKESFIVNPSSIIMVEKYYKDFGSILHLSNGNRVYARETMREVMNRIEMVRQ